MKDLTKGYPAKVILYFALPLILGNIFQQLYNMADSKIVSMYVSPKALGAVGATAVVSNTLIFLINGLTQGFGILVAKSFGGRDEENMHRYVAGTIYLTAVSTVILTLFGEACIKGILKLLSTPEDIFDPALSYVRIIIFGIAFTAVYNMCANLLRAVGDSKTPLYMLIAGLLCNVGLDLLFVGSLGLGIEGAAYATVLSQALCAFLIAGYILLRFRILLPRKGEWQLLKGQLSELITTGLAMGMMGCIVNLGSVVLQGAINNLGTTIVIAHTAARRIFDILGVLLFTIGTAMTTYVSQNLGAGKYDRIRQGVRHALVIELIAAAIIMVICFVFGRAIVCWLASTDNEEVIRAAVLYIRISVCFYYVLGPLFVLRCTLQGLGRRVIPVLSSVMEMLVKIFSAAFLVPWLAYTGVALTEPISWIIMTILLAGAYFSNLPKEPETDFAAGGENQSLNDENKQSSGSNETI